MKLFAKKYLSWAEPTLFVVRMRDRRGWVLRLLLVLGIAAVMMTAFCFQANFQQRMGIGGGLLLSLAIGAILVAFSDAPNYRRDVSITSDNINCFGVAGTAVTSGTWSLTSIRSARLVTPEELGKPFGMLVLDVGNKAVGLGVPRKMSLEKIAIALYRLQIPVELPGWDPSTAEQASVVSQDIAPAPEIARTAEPARVWPVSPTEERMTSGSVEAVGLVIALWPLVLALLFAVGIGIYLAVSWRQVALMNKGVLIGAAVAAVVGAISYVLRVGAYLATRYQIRIARQVVQFRSGAIIDPNDPRLICAEIFERQKWESVVARASDFGFLLLDARKACLLFEGNKQRWTIPIGAVRSCRIEEARVGAQTESEGEKRYFVVLATELDGQPWEAPLVTTRTAFGSTTNATRLAAAQELLGRIAEIMPPLT